MVIFILSIVSKWLVYKKYTNVKGAPQPSSMPPWPRPGPTLAPPLKSAYQNISDINASLPQHNYYLKTYNSVSFAPASTFLSAQ